MNNATYADPRFFSSSRAPVPAHDDVGNTILDTVGSTPLVRVRRLFAGEAPGEAILAKLEFMNPGGSMKDRIALKMIERAERDGILRPGDTLVEPTSGNTGVGLAMVAAVKGYRMIIVMPVKMSEEKRRLLKAYGAELILTPTELPHDHPDNYIEVAKRIARENPRTHLLNQYENPGNPDAHYESTGPEIWAQTGGRIDYFVSGMGTGGTITGIARYLKEKNPAVKIIGIDPAGSIYTGGAPAPYQVEGIGYDFYPKVFKTGLVDRMIRVGDAESFREARRMAKQEGILAGGSTGSVIAGTRRLLSEIDSRGKTIVIMAHDSGRSYLSKIYNDEWMRENGFMEDADEI